ncbi:MAG: hypothetical protein V7752_12180 [Halopseudomonas sp.]
METRIASVTNELLQRVTVGSKLWLTLSATLLIGLILISSAFQADQRKITEQQLNALGMAIGQQTAASSAALILAGDKLSLSINLQQLAALPQISGAEVFNQKGISLAQAGTTSELSQEHPIVSEKTALGMLRIHLNPATTDYALVLPMTLTMAVATALLLLTAFCLLSRHLSRPLNALIYAAEQLSYDNPITPLDAQRHDELGQIAKILNPRFAEAIVEPEPEPEPEPDPEPKLEPKSEPDLPAQSSTMEPDSNSSITAEQQPIDSPQPAPANPVDVLTDTCHQAGDSESTAPISPPNNGYLFYINHHVGGSDTLTTTEREQLLVRYRKALEQVARLYKGALDEDVLGNWCVRFSPLSSDQSHGINALCAAQLFNALYRGINTQAIRNFSPALNMKLVLLCGPLDHFDALAEDALLLSDQIQDNDLITHETLYQIPVLQQRMLGSAKYRKFDDDTYLLSALNDDYQVLIDRQAEHFLKQNA